VSDATSTNPLLANYEFHKDSERAIVYYLCTSPTFWHAGGQHLLPNLMGPQESKLLTAAVREIVKETRVPPKHYAVVLQRLHTQSPAQRRRRQHRQWRARTRRRHHPN
jgi:hypothetical protein